MLANHVYAHLLLLLQPSVLWLSIVTFNNYVKPHSAKVNFAWIWCIPNPTPTSLSYLTLKRWHDKIWPLLRGLPGVADRATHLEGSPHLSCKSDQIKMRDYMDRQVRVTRPKWVTVPTWGPPPACKQALKVSPALFLQFQQLNHSPFIIGVNLVALESHFYDLISCYYVWTWAECFRAKCRGFMIICAVFWIVGQLVSFFRLWDQILFCLFLLCKA